MSSYLSKLKDLNWDNALKADEISIIFSFENSGPFEIVDQLDDPSDITRAVREEQSTPEFFMEYYDSPTYSNYRVIVKHKGKVYILALEKIEESTQTLTFSQRYKESDSIRNALFSIPKEFEKCKGGCVGIKVPEEFSGCFYDLFPEGLKYLSREDLRMTEYGHGNYLVLDGICPEKDAQGNLDWVDWLAYNTFDLDDIENLAEDMVSIQSVLYGQVKEEAAVV